MHFLTALARRNGFSSLTTASLQIDIGCADARPQPSISSVNCIQNGDARLCTKTTTAAVLNGSAGIRHAQGDDFA